MNCGWPEFQGTFVYTLPPRGYSSNRQNYLLFCSSNPGFPLQRSRSKGGVLLVCGRTSGSILIYEIAVIRPSELNGLLGIGKHLATFRYSFGCVSQKRRKSPDKLTGRQLDKSIELRPFQRPTACGASFSFSQMSSSNSVSAFSSKCSVNDHGRVYAWGSSMVISTSM